MNRKKEVNEWKFFSNFWHLPCIRPAPHIIRFTAKRHSDLNKLREFRCLIINAFFFHAVLSLHKINMFFSFHQIFCIVFFTSFFSLLFVIFFLSSLNFFIIFLFKRILLKNVFYHLFSFFHQSFYHLFHNFFAKMKNPYPLLSGARSWIWRWAHNAGTGASKKRPFGNWAKAVLNTALKQTTAINVFIFSSVFFFCLKNKILYKKMPV